MKTMVLPALTALKTSGVQSWLGQELEMRGIDAMIYTRYILSILLQEDVDEMAEVDVDGGSGFGRKMGYVKVKGKKKGRVDKEELKKTAAVQCLQSVSDQINDLVTPDNVQNVITIRKNCRYVDLAV